MNDYGPYVAAVYLLSLVVYGGYILRWQISLKRLNAQLNQPDGSGP
ncbi:MAG: hypothetical protein HQL96_16945 [Magnetococcales bacterium]|nr:hypothetical protein [Magnetococcales bacterium]